MNLHDTLTQVVPDINNHLEHINYGGCGWFAHTLSTILAAKGIQSDIVLMKWAWYKDDDVARMIDSQSVDTINDAYRKMFNDDTSYCNPCFGHIGVRVGDVIYDSDGVLTVPAISEPIERAVMHLALTKGSAWNSKFLGSNRGDAVHKMKEFLTQALSEVAA